MQAPPNLTERLRARCSTRASTTGAASRRSRSTTSTRRRRGRSSSALRAATRARGLELAPRLTVYPRFVGVGVARPGACCRAALRASDSLGLAREDAWSPGETGDGAVRRRARPAAASTRAASSARTRSRACSARAARSGSACFAARRRAAARGERRRRHATSSRGTSSTRTSATSAAASARSRRASSPRTCAARRTSSRTRRSCAAREEAWERGATEICLQGGIHPAFDGDYYASVVRAIKDAVPELHVHAFSALEIWQGAATLGVPLRDYLERLRDEGLASLPGTAAEVLDDEVRAVICPDKITTAQWLEVHETAHEVGLRSNNTIMFGHVDGPRSWARHLRRGARRCSGGRAASPSSCRCRSCTWRRRSTCRGRARRGPTWGETLLMHAVGRLALHPWITNVQVSWVKAGPQGAVEALRAGVNDLGGTLMNESISRAAGAEWGQELSAGADGGADPLGRPRSRASARRSTATPPPEQVARSFGARAARRAVEPARERGAARAAARARPASVVPRTSMPGAPGCAGRRAGGGCSCVRRDRPADAASRHDRPRALGQAAASIPRWTLRIAVAGDRPVRARAARPVRALAHEPARAGRTEVGLAADAGARAEGVLRLPLEPHRLALVLERGAGLVARAERRDAAAGRISTSASGTGRRRAPAMRSRRSPAARCRPGTTRSGIRTRSSRPPTSRR